MKNLQPIGIFDSGVGGTSIFQEIHELLPLEHIIYLADSKNAPYGERPKEEIVSLSIKNADLLVEFGCKLIVVACNTATTNAINQLRNRYDIPVIGIEPAIKPAALKSHNKRVGILATKGTLSSELFCKTSDLFAKDIEIIEVVGTGLVQAIEAGLENTFDTKENLQRLLKPVLDKNIDYLVLGCSHYPYLIDLLKEILPAHVTIIDSGEAVAKQTHTVLKSMNLLADVQQNLPKFFSNKNPAILKKLLNIKNPKNNFEVSYLDF